MSSDEAHPRTLYVGNLHTSVTEELLVTLFSNIGQVKSCKVIREPGSLDPYAFLEFFTHQGAAAALSAMNKRKFLEKEMKVNWASTGGSHPKVDISNHHHVFVGDLSLDIDSHALREAFSPYGEISNCRIVRDPNTLKSKGYAFVSFVNRSAAEAAINSMNGSWLGSRTIRTNWSTRKPPQPRIPAPRPNFNKPISYDDVYNQTSPTNCTVYCGGFMNGMCEELMQHIFSQFGSIVDIRAFKDKGYAFIKFSTKESAARAIEAVHNSDIQGNTVKCFWGKESGDTGSGVGGGQNHHSGPGYPYAPYQQHMNYWYAQQGQQQYYQGMPQSNYGYGQYGYQHQNYGGGNHPPPPSGPPPPPSGPPPPGNAGGWGNSVPTNSGPPMPGNTPNTIQAPPAMAYSAPQQYQSAE